MTDKYYSAHEDAYRKFKQERRDGWHTREEQEHAFAVLEGIASADYFPPGGRILELGCGDGEKGLWFAARGYGITGVDISPTAIEWAREKARSRGLSAEFAVDDVVALQSQKAESFDVAIDAECLHCLVGEDRRRYLATVVRVLKKGGVFVVFGTMCQPLRKPDLWLKAPARFDAATEILFTDDKPFRQISSPEKIGAQVEEAGMDILWRTVEEGDGVSKDQGWDRLRMAARKRASP